METHSHYKSKDTPTYYLFMLQIGAEAGEILNQEPTLKENLFINKPGSTLLIKSSI